MKKIPPTTITFTEKDHSVFTPSKDHKPIICVSCKKGPVIPFFGTIRQCLVIMKYKKRPKIRNIK